MTIQITVPEDNAHMNDKVRRCATMLMMNDVTVEVTWADGRKQSYTPIKTRRDHTYKLLNEVA